MPDAVWDRAILDSDLLIRRVPSDRRAPRAPKAAPRAPLYCSLRSRGAPSPGRAALATWGRRVGGEVAATQHGEESLAPTTWAHRLGLKIGAESGPLFASFTEPATLGLNRESLAAAESLLQRSGSAPRLGPVPLAEVLVAHELFHYWEMRLPDLPTSARQPDILRLGPFHRAARLSSLGEIAAMAFAQALTGLPFSPFALTAALLWPQDRSAAEAYSAAVREPPGAAA